MNEARDQLISVVMPAYNCEQYLGEAIESVLSQNYPLIHLIIADDGSTDRTADVAQSFGEQVEYLCQAHAGVGAALNLGLRSMRGSLLAFLDADDAWTTGKLARQVAVLNENPGVDMVFGQMEKVYGGVLGDALGENPREENVIPGIGRDTLLIRTDSFNRIGQFESHYVLGEFIEWYARAMEIGLTSVVLPEVLVRRRIHGANTVLRQKKSEIDYVHVLKKSLDRRRKRLPGGNSPA